MIKFQINDANSVSIRLTTILHLYLIVNPAQWQKNVLSKKLCYQQI